MNWTEADLAARNSATRSNPAGTPLKAKGRLRAPRGQNKGEIAYGAHLALEQRLGEIAFFAYEGITLKLAEDVRYTPDYLVLRCDGQVECHEIKGKKTFKREDGSVIRTGAYIKEDSRIKIAVAAKQFPFRFVMVWPGTNGDWESKEY